MDTYTYKNTTGRVQSINTNQGRSLHVHARSTVDLLKGEESSPEIRVKTQQRPKQGEVSLKLDDIGADSND